MKMKRVFIGLILLVVHIAWFALLFRFPDFSLFIVFLPIAFALNFSPNPKIRNAYISIFVVLWLGLFQYESLRGFLFNEYFKLDLPKTKFLFPPAGWIMFYVVEPEAGYYEVLGIKGGNSYVLDPHDIFRVRTIGYDNIHRGILGVVHNPRNPAVAVDFCRYLNRRYDDFDKFTLMGYYYPDIIEKPYDRRQRVIYQCDDKYVRF